MKSRRTLLKTAAASLAAHGAFQATVARAQTAWPSLYELEKSWSASVAVQPVLHELFSAPNSLLTGKLTGNSGQLLLGRAQIIHARPASAAFVALQHHGSEQGKLPPGTGKFDAGNAGLAILDTSRTSR